MYHSYIFCFNVRLEGILRFVVLQTIHMGVNLSKTLSFPIFCVFVIFAHFCNSQIMPNMSITQTFHLSVVQHSIGVMSLICSISQYRCHVTYLQYSSVQVSCHLSVVLLSIGVISLIFSIAQQVSFHLSVVQLRIGVMSLICSIAQYRCQFTYLQYSSVQGSFH